MPLLIEGGNEVRIREDVARDADFEPADLRRLIADELLAQAPWLRRAYTREEIEGEGDTDGEDGLLALVRKSYHPERSADVVMVMQPWTIPNLQGTTHGSPYDYDRIVPLAFLGPGIESQIRYDDARTIDLLPTLFARLGLPLAAEVDGRILGE